MVRKDSLRRGSSALILACLLGLPAVASDIPAGTTEQAEAGLKRLRHFLEDVQSLRAAFRQEVIDRDQNLVESASGRVALKRPGRFRWDYVAPYERLIVADSVRVWLYESDLEQVTIRRLDAGLGETPAALLTGRVDVLDRFDYGGSEMEAGLEWVELRPRSAESDFDAIRLGFDGDLLAQLALEDRLGQITRLYFADVEVNPEIADAVFQFEPPEGVDVIGETEL